MNRTLRTLVLTTTGALLVPLLAILAASPAVAATTACAGPVLGDKIRFTWTNDDGNNRWDDNGNWAVTDATGAALPDRAPNYFGTAASDDSTTGLVCVNPTVATTILLDGTVHVHVQALEVGGKAQLDMRNGTRVMVYGDPADFTTVVHDDASGTDNAEILLRGSTLGGPGLIRVDGDLIWGQSPSGASTLDHDYCESFPDRDVNECAALVANPEQLQVGNGGVVHVGGRGVNLSDGYHLAVNPGGTLRIAGAGYIAADRDTELLVRPQGLFDLAGDGNVFEGFANGQPDPDLAEFTNLGTVRKSAGTGRSALNVVYGGTGNIDVRSGGISIAGGTELDATVGAGSRIGTGRCGGPNNDATNAVTKLCTPGTDAEDPQFAVLRPQVRTAGLAVVEGLTTEPGTGDVQPAVRVRAPSRDIPSTLDFQFDDAIVGRPVRLRMTIFHTRPGLASQRVPLCRPGGAIPAQVNGCVVGRRGVTGAVRMRVNTRRPGGFWSLRPSGVDFARLVTPLVGTRPGCQVMHPTYPYVTRQAVYLRDAGRYQVRFARYENTRGTGVRMGGVRSGADGRNEPALRVERTGWVALLATGADGTQESSGAFRVVATPTVRFLDRSRFRTAGRPMIVRGLVKPGGRRTVRLYAARVGGRFGILRATRAQVRTSPAGRFTVRFTPPRQGRYVLAVSVAGADGLSTAMSRQAVKVRVKPRPPRPTPGPIETQPFTSSETTSTATTGRTTDPLDVLDAFYPGRVATCRFRVRY